MTGHELRTQQAKQFAAGVQFLERHPNAPAHEAVSTVVAMCPDLAFEYLQIAFSDWCSFRLETQAEIDSMLLRAIERRVP
jgi:hypothetical protein